MAKYLLIESRDPFENMSVKDDYTMAADLAKADNEVTFFLVQNGVLPARKTVKSNPIETLGSSGVEVLADEFSLRERGIATDGLAAGIKSAPLDIVVDQLADGSKTIWL